MKPYLKAIGSLGETLAENYLIENNWKILNKNYQIGHLEIDIIAQNKKEIVFIEVKTRTSLSLGGSEQALSFGKIQKIKKAMFLFSGTNKISLENMRFDFIAILLNKKTRKASLKHFFDILK